MQGTNGLPLGAQLVGRRDDDARLLRTSRWLVGRVRGSGGAAPQATGSKA
jgi:Asp-tRNA(Asn)/Glu-tRNA(Gln) amidotransferase A subunit family amidase